MKTILLIIGLCFALVAGASAQPITTDKGKKSDETFTKLRKIDLLNQILPLLLTKEQINRDFLPAVEKARGRWKQVLTSEDEELAKLESRVEEVLSNAIEKDIYPPKDFQTQISNKTREMAIKRAIAMTEMVEALQKVVDTSLTAGQKKALIGSFAPGFVEPGKKPEDIKDETKMRFFIERVLLDPLTREILIEIADKKKG